LSVLKNAEVRNITVPYYDSLSLEKILEQFGEHPEVKPYLCEERDLHRLPRAYLCTLINSRIPEEF
jgi:hypothetical protein